LSALEELSAALRAEGGLLADVLREAPVGDPLPPGERAEVRLLLEAIREGELLHYGRSRILADPEPDLALLGGDRLYALGLQRLAELGDLEAVAALADVISLAAQAHAEGRPDQARAAWAEGLEIVHRARTIGPGAGAAAQGAPRA
jgi:hypothetical protein